MNYKDVILKPRVTEKSYALSESGNTYVFEISPGINRHDVVKAIKAQYEVSVLSVRIASQPGKTKRKYKRGGRVTHKSQTSAIRKAHVTLKESDKLPIFAAVEDEK